MYRALMGVYSALGCLAGLLPHTSSVDVLPPLLSNTTVSVAVMSIEICAVYFFMCTGRVGNVASAAAFHAARRVGHASVGSNDPGFQLVLLTNIVVFFTAGAWFSFSPI